jgi:antitoxin (DNA-binding transcriptional repressor) of toxin-antitoxin stability system
MAPRLCSVPGSSARFSWGHSLDINFNINFMFPMKTISMVELRSHSEAIVRELKQGVRMVLSYRGKPLAELVPMTLDGSRLGPLEALDRAQAAAPQDAASRKVAAAYLRELRADQKDWSGRK